MKTFDLIPMKCLLIVYGNDGLNELTTTLVTAIRHGKVESYEVQPAGLGLQTAKSSDLVGGEPAENAKTSLALLKGEKGPKCDIVLLNAAFAIIASGKVDNPQAGIALAIESMESGAALTKLEALATVSQE